MTERSNTPGADRDGGASAPARRGASSGAIRTILWSVGILAGVLLLGDPFDLHRVDEHLYQAIGIGHAMGKGDSESQAPQLWTCPMHPQILQKEPGSCPICK
ncbi:MAG: hypothetical protein KC729_20315, partial [Candidatus Eisenbacteria bacterium]|nr:hypothetical protein [Candidatus Eisenbacteria bacterium]